jgi:hypothetical protein
MYSEFHTDEEFHKKISEITYKVVKEIEPDALDDFLHFNSGLGNEANLNLAMRIVYNLLETEIKEFYGYDITQEIFVAKVVLIDDYANPLNIKP